VASGGDETYSKFGSNEFVLFGGLCRWQFFSIWFCSTDNFNEIVLLIELVLSCLVKN
jgi:hypothetical protein